MSICGLNFLIYHRYPSLESDLAHWCWLVTSLQNSDRRQMRTRNWQNHLTTIPSWNIMTNIITIIVALKYSCKFVVARWKELCGSHHNVQYLGVMMMNFSNTTTLAILISSPSIAAGKPLLKCFNCQVLVTSLHVASLSATWVSMHCGSICTYEIIGLFTFSHVVATCCSC